MLFQIFIPVILPNTFNLGEHFINTRNSIWTVFCVVFFLNLIQKTSLFHCNNNVCTRNIHHPNTSQVPSILKKSKIFAVNIFGIFIVTFFRCLLYFLSRQYGQRNYQNCCFDLTQLNILWQQQIELNFDNQIISQKHCESKNNPCKSSYSFNEHSEKPYLITFSKMFSILHKRYSFVFAASTI